MFLTGNQFRRRNQMSQPRRIGGRSHDERGASLVEYSMLLALIAVVTFSAVSFFGSSTGGGLGRSSSCISTAYAGTSSGPC